MQTLRKRWTAPLVLAFLIPAAGPARAAGTSYIDLLVQRLFANDINVSRRAFTEGQGLRRENKEALLSALHSLATNEDPIIRREASMFVQAYAPDIDPQYIAEALKNSSERSAVSDNPPGVAENPGLQDTQTRAAWGVAQVAEHATSATLVSETIAGLTQRLSDPDPEERSSAISFLGELGVRAREAVPAVAKCLNDPDLRVRSSATEALRKMNADSAT